MNDRNPAEPELEPTVSETDEAAETDDEAVDQPGAKSVPQPERLADGNYVGEDNIREGHVGGVIGGAHQQGGEGGGG